MRKLRRAEKPALRLDKALPRGLAAGGGHGGEGIAFSGNAALHACAAALGHVVFRFEQLFFT